MAFARISEPGGPGTRETDREGSDRAARDESTDTDTSTRSALPGFRRAVDRTPDPVPAPAPMGATRAVEETPAPAPSPPEPGGQRAVDRTPDPAPPRPEPGTRAFDRDPSTFEPGPVRQRARETFDELRDSPAAGGLATAAGAAVVAPEPVSTGTGAAVLGGLFVAGVATDVARRSEIDVGEDIFGTASEIATPDEGGRGFRAPEIEVPAVGVGAFGGSEKPVGEGDALPSQELPPAPPVTERGEVGIRTGALLEQQKQRQREEDVTFIGGEDIAGELPPVEQFGPSVREQQRRDDMFVSRREFPTGSSAVVGGAVADEAQVTEPSVSFDSVESAEQNIRDFQTSLGAPSPGVRDVPPTPLVDSTQRTGAGTLPDLDTGVSTAEDTVPDLANPPAQATEPLPDFSNPPENPPLFENPTPPAPATATPNVPGTPTRTPRPKRLEIPDLGLGKSKEDEDDPFLLDKEFISPVASGEDVLSGKAFETADFDIDDVGGGL